MASVGEKSGLKLTVVSIATFIILFLMSSHQREPFVVSHERPQYAHCPLHGRYCKIVNACSCHSKDCSLHGVSQTSCGLPLNVQYVTTVNEMNVPGEYVSDGFFPVEAQRPPDLHLASNEHLVVTAIADARRLPFHAIDIITMFLFDYEIIGYDDVVETLIRGNMHKDVFFTTHYYDVRIVWVASSDQFENGQQTKYLLDITDWPIRRNIHQSNQKALTFGDLPMMNLATEECADKSSSALHVLCEKAEVWCNTGYMKEEAYRELSEFLRDHYDILKGMKRKRSLD